jgi:photosystem II stability/assembly factor-like uncharacterized protein
MKTPCLRISNLSILVALLLSVAGMARAAQSVPAELFSGLNYRLIGPFRGGRAVAVAGVPGDATTFYFGGVDGGIWKTTDGGMVWRPIFDSEPVASIGALAVAASDPQVIYAGTGESDIRSNLASGDGVYRSSDAGQSWQNVGLSDSRQISRIVIDPRDPNVVYAGVLGHAYAANAERGVFKSIDGGAQWSKVLDQGPEIGVADLAMATESPNLLFACTWHTQRVPWSTYAPIDGPGGGIYRSQNEGRSWSRLSGSGLPDGDWGRTAVAVSPNGRRVYALIEAAQKSGLYRSDDGGDTWTLANADRRLTSRAWYFGNITIDPNHADVFYVPNVALYRSEDGGKTISVVRGAPGGDDYHQIWVDPKNSAHLVLGTDQGTTISLDYGKTWTSWYNQPTAQLYHVITDNRFPYVVYGAQQDSGSAAVLSRTDHGQITPRDWFPAGDSESGYLAPDPSNPDIIYLSGVYGTVDRFDLRTSFSQDITPWPFPNFGTDIAARRYRDPWTPVLLFSPADKKTLYLGTQYVMKTMDGGLHWQTISPDLTGARPDANRQGKPTVANAIERGYGVVYTIAPSGLDANLIWAGSDTGLIHISRDGGKTWKNVTPPGIGPWSKISLIAASHFNAGEAYAAVERHRLDDRTPLIYRTRNFGESWQLIARGIPSPAFVHAVREDPTRQGLLFAGTEFGIYVSFDDGSNWQSLQLNLPITSVPDVAIHGDDLIVATHGRSFWILDDITPLRQASEALKAAGTFLYRPATALRIDNDSFPGTPIPPEEPTAENPPNGAIIDYYLHSPAQTVKLEIVDARRHLTCSFSSTDQNEVRRAPLPIAERWFPKPQRLEKTEGMHRFVWDLAWGGREGVDDDSEYGSPHGPRAVPGNYEIRLTIDGQTWTQPLTVKMDPRSSATPQELEQQLKLGQQIFTETIESRRLLAEINSVEKQLSDLEPKLTGRADLEASASRAKQKIKDILSGSDKERSTLSETAGLETANTGLAAALRVVESSDRAFPSQAIEVFQTANAAFKSAADSWNAFRTSTLPLLNQHLEKENLPPIPAAKAQPQ